MKNETFEKVFRRIAFVLLILTVITIPLLTIFTHISYSNYISLVKELGVEDEAVKNYKLFDMSASIYDYNSVICTISIIAQVIYFGTKFINRNKKITFAEKMKKNWPILLLAFFMIWTSVGCIQAGMEMDAEIIVNSAKNIDEVPARIVEIANWSSGDRMANTSDRYQNAKDRAWNGCKNLKDGYFSFMFYATVFLNILMLGKNARNHKKWIIRLLLITSLIMALLNIMAFVTPETFVGVIYPQRLTFNNSNHFGYYISVVLIMSVCMFLDDESISSNFDDKLYFRGLAFINCLLYIPILLFNNTFGAYLGVACALIFLFIVSLIRLISRKKIAEFVKCCIVLIVFIACSNVYVSADSGAYSSSLVPFVYQRIRLNWPGKNTIEYSYNSVSGDLAKTLGAENLTLNKEKVKWGNQVEEFKTKQKSATQRNFDGLFNDINVIFGFYKKQVEEAKIITQEDMTQKIFEIASKYPKVSGETMEEYFARQEKIDKETQEYLKANELLDASGNIKKLPTEAEVSGSKNKSGLDDDVSSTGSGRGEVWIKSLDLMNQRPMFGWGLENLLNEFVNQFGVNEGRTHNLVLQLGGTVGIPGVLMYLVATISIWLKVIFDVKLRKYDKKGSIIVCAVFVLATIVLNIIISRITDKLLFNGLFTVGLWAILYACIFIKSGRLRVKDWNEFEFIGAGVFVSYMISSLFGNSAFYTSPYFMIFLGILAYEMINKTPRFEEEKGAESK